MPTKQKVPSEDLPIEEQAPSNEELWRQLQALKAQLGEKDEVIAQQKAELKALQAREAGWLITTPNPQYDEITYGVQFINGQAFLAVDRKVQYFEVTPLTDGQLSKYPAEERMAIREREQSVTPVDRAILAFKEMGYNTTFFESVEELQSVIDARARERAELEALQDQIREKYEPYYTGR